MLNHHPNDFARLETTCGSLLCELQVFLKIFIRMYSLDTYYYMYFFSFLSYHFFHLNNLFGIVIFVVVVRRSFFILENLG